MIDKLFSTSGIPEDPKSLRHIITYVTAAIVVALIFNYDIVLRGIISFDDRVGMSILSSRTDLGDNYFYYEMARAGPWHCFFGNELTDLPAAHVSCTYPGAVAASHLIYFFSASVAPAMRFEPLLTIVLHTALLALAVLLTFHCIRGKTLGFPTAMALAGVTLLLIDNFSLSFYTGTLYGNLANVFNREPNYQRLVNPTTAWSIGLFFVASYLFLLERYSARRLAFCLLMAALAGVANFPVGATLLCALGLFGLVELIVARRVPWVTVLIGSVMLGALALLYWRYHMYWQSSMGEDLRHGRFLGLQVKPAFLLLLPLAVIGRIHPEGGAPDRFLKSLLAASALIGFFCDSFELGSRIWIRGASVFALICCLAWIVTNFIRQIEFLGLPHAGNTLATIQLRQSRTYFALAGFAVAMALLGVVAWAKPPPIEGWRGFLDHDKVEVISWLQENASKRTVVASTNLEDSYLVSIYTPARPLVTGFGLSSRESNENLERYFSVLSHFSFSRSILQATAAMTKKDIDDHYSFLFSTIDRPYDYKKYQPMAIYKYVIHYPYAGSFKNILSDRHHKAEFTRWLVGIWRAAQAADYAFDYLIVRNSELEQFKGDAKVVFRNDTYSILAEVSRVPSSHTFNSPK